MMDNDDARQASRQRTSQLRVKIVGGIRTLQADRHNSDFPLLVEAQRHRPGLQECRQGSIQSTG